MTSYVPSILSLLAYLSKHGEGDKLNAVFDLLGPVALPGLLSRLSATNRWNGGERLWIDLIKMIKQSISKADSVDPRIAESLVAVLSGLVITERNSYSSGYFVGKDFYICNALEALAARAPPRIMERAVAPLFAKLKRAQRQCQDITPYSRVLEVIRNPEVAKSSREILEDSGVVLSPEDKVKIQHLLAISSTNAPDGEIRRLAPVDGKSSDRCWDDRTSQVIERTARKHPDLRRENAVFRNCGGADFHERIFK